MDEMAWGEVNLKCLMEHVGWGLHKLNNVFHDFSTVAVVFAAPALPSRLCQKWQRMNEMASYEAPYPSRDVIGACGLGFAPAPGHSAAEWNSSERAANG